MEEAKGPSALHILVFGGNGFMGSDAVVSLVAQGHVVYTANRGNAYWDSATRVSPHVVNVYCDRDKPMVHARNRGFVALCERVASERRTWNTAGRDTVFDVIVDFSGTEPQHMRNGLAYLAGKVALYIHISSDSVYDVCSCSKSTTTSTSTGRREDEAERPADSAVRRRLARADSYGHEKLQCEELLRAAVSADSSTTAMNYVILRLPDVVGPRDNSGRWLAYQLWLMFGDTLCLPRMCLRPSLKDRKLSFVFSPDVARVVCQLCREFTSARPSVCLNEVFNVASDPLTLPSLLSHMAAALGRPVPSLCYDKQAHQYYPSVDGVFVSIHKIVRMLGFRATPWPAIAAETCTYMRSALTQHSAFTKEAVEEFSRRAVPATSRAQYLAALSSLSEVGQAHSVGKVMSKAELQRIALEPCDSSSSSDDSDDSCSSGDESEDTMS